MMELSLIHAFLSAQCLFFQNFPLRIYTTTSEEHKNKHVNEAYSYSFSCIHFDFVFGDKIQGTAGNTTLFDGSALPQKSGC
jgi:hypothetical protein